MFSIRLIQDSQHSCKAKTLQSQQGNGLTVFMLFLIALMVVAVLVATFAYKVGFNSGQKNIEVESDLVINGELVNADVIKSIQQENEQFKVATNTAKQERDVSISNIDSMRQKIEDVQVENSQLINTIDVFTHTIAKQGGIPLQVIAAKIEPLPENAFEYKFDVAMVSEDDNVQSLRPELKLLNGTSFVSIPLTPSSYDIKGVSYIRGRFVMPEGFTPRQMKLTLNVGDEKIEQLYNWRLGKPSSQTATTLSEVPTIDRRPIDSEDK